MKKGIHPDYKDIKVVLSDGTEFTTRSTLQTKDGVYKTEIDSRNHPFYNTGGAGTKKTAGQIDRFNRRYGGNKS